MEGGRPPRTGGMLGSRNRARFPRTASSQGARSSEPFNPCLLTRTNLLAPPERTNSFRNALGACLIKRLRISPEVHLTRGQRHLRHAAAPSPPVPSPSSHLAVPLALLVPCVFSRLCLFGAYFEEQRRCCCWVGGAAEDQPWTASYGIKLRKKFEGEGRWANVIRSRC